VFGVRDHGHVSTLLEILLANDVKQLFEMFDAEFQPFLRFYLSAAAEDV